MKCPVCSLCYDGVVIGGIKYFRCFLCKTYHKFENGEWKDVTQELKDKGLIDQKGNIVDGIL